MNIKNIFVTGASGKVGRALIPELKKAGYAIRALQHEEPVTEEGVEVIQGDTADPSLAKRAIQDMDAVVHLANVKENREKFLSVNVNGTFYLLDAVKEAGHIQQYIQAGSDARAGIYFNPRPFPIDETFPHAGYPGIYAFSKVLEETMCEQFRIQYGIPISVMRFCWIYDEDDVLAHMTLMEPSFGVPEWDKIAVTPEQKSFFEKKIDGVARLVHPDGKPGVRHVVSIKDIVQGIMLAVGNKAAVGHAFNLCAASPFSYDVAADYVSKKLDIPVVEFEFDPFYDFQNSISKARSFLGFDPKYDIFDIIDDAVEFRKAGKKRTPVKYPG